MKLERVEEKIFENCRVNVAEIAERLGINVARPWCKPQL
jgi:hypothetical protein